MANKRTVIIDGDIIVYKVSEAVADSFEVETDTDDTYIYRKIEYANKKEAIDYVEKFIDRVCRECKATDCVICLSDKNNNFRKQVNPDYKGNRRKVKPVLYDYIREYLKNSDYKLYEKPNLEADDVIGILATSQDKIIKGDKVVWSMDKDFKTIPCKFHKELPNGSHVSQRITEQEADWWFMYQTLIGDKTDGYYGCKGIGDKTARKILGEVGQYSLEKMWKNVVDSFEKMGSNKQEALLNARMARILRYEDYDFKKKEVKLWQITK